jgi:copper chaperone NosL
MKTLMNIYIYLMSLLVFVACQSGPEPIAYGTDNCHHCKMTISDNRYGSEMVTDKGKVYKFDSIECMAQYLDENKSGVAANMLLVTDFKNPGQLLEVNKAFFLQSDQMPSPMGMYLTAFSDNETASKFAAEKSGKLLTWEATQKLCASHGNTH